MNQRVRRVNESIKEILAELLRGLKDPRIGFVTLTDVRTSADLGHSEVFYTVLDPADLEGTAAGLASATPVLRRELAARLRIRHVPDLQFTHDPLPASGERIEALLREVAREDRGTETEDGDR